MKYQIPFLILSLILLLFNNCSNKVYNNYNKLKNKDGKWIEVSTVNDSILFEICVYKNGLKDGKAQIYYKNRSISFGKYKKGKKQDRWVYAIDGKVFKKEYYTEGFLLRIEFIRKGKVIKQVITDPPF